MGTSVLVDQLARTATFLDLFAWPARRGKELGPREEVAWSRRFTLVWGLTLIGGASQPTVDGEELPSSSSVSRSPGSRAGGLLGPILGLSCTPASATPSPASAWPGSRRWWEALYGTRIDFTWQPSSPPRGVTLAAGRPRRPGCAGGRARRPRRDPHRRPRSGAAQRRLALATARLVGRVGDPDALHGHNHEMSEGSSCSWLRRPLEIGDRFRPGNAKRDGGPAQAELNVTVGDWGTALTQTPTRFRTPARLKGLED